MSKPTPKPLHQIFLDNLVAKHNAPTKPVLDLKPEVIQAIKFAVKRCTDAAVKRHKARQKKDLAVIAKSIKDADRFTKNPLRQILPCRELVLNAKKSLDRLHKV